MVWGVHLLLSGLDLMTTLDLCNQTVNSAVSVLSTGLTGVLFVLALTGRGI